MTEYFLKDSTGVWRFVDLEVSQDLFKKDKSSVYPAYDEKSDQGFWLVHANDLFYRLEYNVHIKEASVAKLLNVPNETSRASREGLLPEMSVEFFNEKAYNSILKEGREAHQKTMSLRNLQTKDLLTQEDLFCLLQRPADLVQRLQANPGMEDIVYTQTQAFQKRSDLAYCIKIYQELSSIIEQNPTDYVAATEAFKAYLTAHWEQFKDTPVSYMALPEHPVTKLLVGLSEKIAGFEGRPAISYLMPGVYTESQSDAFRHLTEQKISTVLKTHILDDSGRYLLPIQLVLAYIDKTSPLWNPSGFCNPYYDGSSHDIKGVYLTHNDIERLFRHSVETQALKIHYDNFEWALNQDTTLLGQLNRLVKVLKLNDAHGGMGRETDVGEGVYTAAPLFMRYYRRLHHIGLHVADKGLSSFSEAFSSGCDMGYVLVPSGPDAGLYFLSPNMTRKLCDADTKARYPMDVMVLDTPDYQGSLSHERPTLIRISSNPSGTYRVYGQNEQGEWAFTEIKDAGSIVLPQAVSHPVTQSPGNIPEKIYQEIDKQSAHFCQRKMLDVLSQELKSSNECTLEQLNLIYVQTGHLDIDEFPEVPEPIKASLSSLWIYLSNPSKNISATESIGTCVGILREALELAITEHASSLNSIKWSDEEKQNLFQDSQLALIQSKDSLSTLLQQEKYVGIDIRYPSPKMCSDLNLTLEIKTYADFKWFCFFPAEHMDAFLSDSNHPDPLGYLTKNYCELPDLAQLLLEIPTSAYQAIMKHCLFVSMCAKEISDLVKFVGNDKSDVLFEVMQKRLTDSIKCHRSLSRALCGLSEAQTQKVLEALILENRLVQIISSATDLLRLFAILTDETKRQKVLDAVKGRLENIIQCVEDLRRVLYLLSEAQIQAVLDAVKGRLENIIQCREDLSVVLYLLSEAQIQAVLEALTKDHLMKIIKDRYDLASVFKALPKKAQIQSVLNSVQKYLGAIINDYYVLHDVIRALSEGQRQQVLEALTKEHLVTIIKDVHGLCLLLPDLDEGGKDWVLGVLIQEHLVKIINNGEDLGKALYYLSEVQTQQVLAALTKEHLVTIINDGEGLANALSYLSEAQTQQVLAALTQEGLVTIIKDGSELSTALVRSPELKCKYVLEALTEKHLVNIIKTGTALPTVLRYLTGSNIKIQQVLKALTKDHLVKIINTGASLCQALYQLTEDQTQQVLEALTKEHLVTIIKDGTALRSSFGYLTKDQAKQILEALTKEHLVTIIKDGSELLNALYGLNAVKTAAVLEALTKEHLVTIIKNASELCKVLRKLSDAQKKQLLDALDGCVVNIIKNGKDFAVAFLRWNDPKSPVLEALIKEGLVNIIKDGDQLSAVLEMFERPDIRRVLEAMQEHLGQIIKNYSQLCAVLKYLDKDQTTVVLSALTQEDLKRIINNSDDMIENVTVLDKILDYFSSLEQREELYACLKDKLSGFKSSKYNQEMNVYLNRYNPRFFSRDRDEGIHTDSFVSKLSRYITTRSTEGRFHYDFLGLQVFFQWLLGGVWVKAKETKIAAATYASYVYQNKDEHFVRLFEIADLPLKMNRDSYKNSYCLIGKKQLYYIDYQGHAVKVSSTDLNAIKAFFQMNKDNRLTYNDVNEGLSAHVRGLLPTQAQREALKEGRLSDIVCRSLDLI